MTDDTAKSHPHDAYLMGYRDGEAARDAEANAMVAAAYEAAADFVEEWVESAEGHLDSTNQRLLVEETGALTPADARAALEAYGRRKMVEGMWKAADIARGRVRACEQEEARDSDGIGASCRLEADLIQRRIRAEADKLECG